MDWEAIRLSVFVAVAAVCLNLVPGIGMAWLLAKCEFRGKVCLDAIVHLPLVLPPVVVGYALLLLFRPQSELGTLARNIFGSDLAFTGGAAVVAASVMSFPLMVRSVRLSLERIDRNLEGAAKVLGASPLKVFFSVSLPLSFSGILAGSVMAFARSLGEFGATIIFAGNIAGETRTVPLSIFTSSQVPGREHEALLMAAVSVALALGAMYLSEIWARQCRKQNI